MVKAEIFQGVATGVSENRLAGGARELDLTLLAAPARVGGLETVVASLARGLARRRHQVRVLALMGSRPEDRCLPFESLAEAGIEVTEIRLPPRRYWAERRWVIDRLARFPNTILHCHGYHADLVGWLATRAGRRRMVSTAHGFSARTAKGRFYEALDRWVLARSDAVIAVSKPLQDLLLGAGAPTERVHLVPNAWSPTVEPVDRAEARALLGLPAEGPVIGWVGRLTEEKGPDVFLAAVSQLPESRASIIGEGAMLDSLVREADRLGVAPSIRWHGMVPSAGRLVSAFDVLVLSSWTEGTPMVLLEAMAAGVPIVTTAVGGVPDVVSESEAILVQPGDPTALAKAIQRCLAEPATAAARAEAAKARLGRDHQADRWLDRHEAVYRGVACR